MIYINRKTRRKFNFTNQESNVLKYLINMAKIKQILDNWKPIPEGTKVKLNVNKITNYNDWDNNNDDYNHKRYKEWVLTHQNDTFTIEYGEKHKNNPQLLCLKEDETIPKWLFSDIDLIVVKE